MKIQINSLEALERLIGGDTEVEIELRNTIVQEFTKTHLKAIANLQAVATVGAELKKEIINDVYAGMQNAGFVDHFIPTGLHTADYDLPGGQIVRVKEERNKVYYNVFRAK